jgi:hypothetical protein
MNINTVRDAWVLLLHHCYTRARTHTHTHSYCIQTENLFTNIHTHMQASINTYIHRTLLNGKWIIYFAVSVCLWKITHTQVPVYVQKTQNRKKKWFKNVFVNTTRKKKKIMIFLFSLRGVRSLFFAEGGVPLDRLVDGQFKNAQVLGKQVSFLQTHTHALSLSHARAHTHTHKHTHTNVHSRLFPTGFLSIHCICLLVHRAVSTMHL